MKQTRREFIKSTSIALVGATFAFEKAFSKGIAPEMLAVQLYSVRDDMKKDPMGTLKQIASIGYKNVEHANYVDRKFYGHSAADFKKVLADLGMSMPSGHTVLGKNHWDAAKKDFTDAWKYTVEDAATAGQRYVISPWLDQSLRQTEDDLKRFMEVFNKAGELCKKSGMKFGYHNHDFEFSQKLGDKTVYDLILSNTDPSGVMQQLDTGNLYNGGAKAIDIVKKFPGRFESMHVKDEILAPIAIGGGHEKYESTVLGKGIVNVKEVIDLGRNGGGTVHFCVEQEAYQGKTPIACAKEDFEQMKAWGY